MAQGEPDVLGGGEGPPDRIFFDGSCGLCHWTVRFVLRRDRPGGAFRFAPLGGSTFERSVPLSERPGLPDSVVVLTGDGRVLARSGAVLYILQHLGGFWRAIARAARLIPRRLLDLAYDGVARVRRLLFRRPEEICPVVEPRLKDRFDP